MLFQFNITLTDEDYLAFNSFHAFGSKQGQKALMKSRLIYIGAMVALIALLVLFTGWSSIATLYAGLLASFTLVYMLIFKKVLQRNMKAQIKRMKQTGRLPYEAVSTIEFYEDKMVEISPNSRTEESYEIFERVCVLKDRYILLYRSSISAYILPIPQVKTQIHMEEFLSFLSQKCGNVVHY